MSLLIKSLEPVVDLHNNDCVICSIWDLQMFFCWDHCHSIIHYTTNLWLFTLFDFLPHLTHFLDLTPQFMSLSLVWLLIELDMTEYRFPWGICNGCGMLTEDVYSSGHLVLSHIGTCKCYNFETNLSLTCLVSGLFEFRTSLGTSILLVPVISFEDHVSKGITHSAFYG